MQRWRTEDIEQKVLNNAVVLWERYAEQNRRFVEERSEQLKSFANLAALITGFAIVSFLQASHTLLMAASLTCLSLRHALHVKVHQPIARQANALCYWMQFDFDVAAANQGVVLAFGMTMALVVSCPPLSKQSPPLPK